MYQNEKEEGKGKGMRTTWKKSEWPSWEETTTVVESEWRLEPEGEAEVLEIIVVSGAVQGQPVRFGRRLVLVPPSTGTPRSVQDRHEFSATVADEPTIGTHTVRQSFTIGSDTDSIDAEHADLLEGSDDGRPVSEVDDEFRPHEEGQKPDVCEAMQRIAEVSNLRAQVWRGSEVPSSMVHQSSGDSTWPSPLCGNTSGGDAEET